MKSKNKVYIILIMLSFLFVIYIGPMKGFCHGHYYEEYDFSQISEDDKFEQISLENNDFEMEFSPKKDYLNGFSICLYNQPEDNEGTLVLRIYDESDKEIGCTNVDLRNPRTGNWYKVDITEKLIKNNIYRLKFSAMNCKYYPCLQKVDREYLPDETVNGNILLAYSYARPTFNNQEKIMIILFIIAIDLVLIGAIVRKNKKQFNIAGIVLFLSMVLSWNYMHNSMDMANTIYDYFQMDSESLVVGTLCTVNNDRFELSTGEEGYGLGHYYDLKGEVFSYGSSFQTDDNWNEGYSRENASIIINSNEYTREVALVGNNIKFSNGDSFLITSIDDDGTNIIIYLDNDSAFMPLKYGSLSGIIFVDSNNNELPIGKLSAYKSQYGLQGRIFKCLSLLMEKDNVYDNLHLVCCILTAMVFSLIVVIISIKYNIILAGCFYITFWLSPWITSYARNLYWVEFTWFLPMLVGLVCTWKIEEKKSRYFSYIACFLSVLLKCLCGYEYISVVMMGLISFMTIEAVETLVSHNKEKSILLLRTIIIIGIMSLIGFAVAILIHARVRGAGDILQGVKEIIKQDVLRRTYGGSLNDFESIYWYSFNASVWETFSKYFKFSTQIITGIDGNLFPLLCIIPLGILGYDYKKQNLDVRLLTMYIVFFLTSVSWFCLAKSHSYIHTLLNFVLWYFGFVQVCLYIIVDRAIRIYNDLKKR